ncbi:MULTISPECIES: hypothetical protein [Pseudomonas syringae group]|uniref:hypothetical protein n=1 Tax=Pseudomonas syringae group TaxID=136849 RepID=UPI000EFDBF85|nr:MULTISPECIES: hypothetical protein [Pseudomonas syringae group]MCF5715258.1 hypothetical protein [Pseudomonas tremae]MCF5746083.1 hypothetical protein [Pseudomonas tremae]RMP26204.1 hypothetical protein ALQ25_00145 [Pseudomonas coronafaciens pv. atropurpurea]UQB33639.1 hypothetical protein I9H06_10555 [Pseudomonas tremae]UQB34878.1 hypothetical protein I9H09_14915 [Pseudomonas tremae]
MSEPKSHQSNTRRELRKALIRLRMEMHRQEIRHESTQLLQPLQRFLGIRHDWKSALGFRHAPLWGVGSVALLGFLSGKRAKTGRTSLLGRLLKLGITLTPLIKVAMQSRAIQNRNRRL